MLVQSISDEEKMYLFLNNKKFAGLGIELRIFKVFFHLFSLPLPLNYSTVTPHDKSSLTLASLAARFSFTELTYEHLTIMICTRVYKTETNEDFLGYVYVI